MREEFRFSLDDLAIINLITANSSLYLVKTPHIAVNITLISVLLIEILIPSSHVESSIS